MIISEAVVAKQVLAFINSNGEQGHAELCEVFPDCSPKLMRSVLGVLKERGALESIKRAGQLVVYEITRAGRQELGAFVGGGSIAQPREIIGAGTYYGEDLTRRVARPGAYDAFALPSGGR
jgi:DNA-binding PadR family transcriptional regulator